MIVQSEVERENVGMANWGMLSDGLGQWLGRKEKFLVCKNNGG